MLYISIGPHSNSDYAHVVLEVCVIRKRFNCNSWHTVYMGEPTGGLPQDTQQTLITTKSTYMQGTLAYPCMHIHAHTHAQIHTHTHGHGHGHGLDHPSS